MRFASGEDLPPEVLCYIVEWLLPEGRYPSKKGLAACSLTCHYWAKTIRPLLFARIRLYSLEDATHFQYLLDSPLPTVSPSIEQCAKVVHFDLRGAQTPDILYLIRVLAQRVVVEDVSFSSERNLGPPAPETPSAYTCVPFYGLPTTLPGASLPTNQLYLRDLDFENIRDLVKVVASLTRLLQCHCSNLTFKDHSPVTRVLGRSRCLENITVTGCSDGDLAAQIGLAFTIALHCRRPFAFDTDYRVTIMEAITALVPSSIYEGHLSASVDDQGEFIFWLVRSSNSFKANSTFSDLKYRVVIDGGSATYQTRPPDNSTPAHALDSKSLLMTFDQTKPEVLSALNWDNFDSSFVSLRRRLRLHLSFRSEQNLRWILDSAAEGKILTRISALPTIELSFQQGTASGMWGTVITKDELLSSSTQSTVQDADGQSHLSKNPVQLDNPTIPLPTVESLMKRDDTARAAAKEKFNKLIAGYWAGPGGQPKRQVAVVPARGRVKGKQVEVATI